MKKDKIKDIAKIVGNIMSVISIIFIINRMCKTDLDFTVIRDNALMLSFLSLLYGLHILLLGFSWKWILEGFFNIKLSFYKVSYVFCKANIMKYIPGNVFQYIGRNQLAFDGNCSHKAVASATIIDVIFNIFGVMVMSFILFRKDITNLVKYIVEYINIKVVVLVLLFLLIGIVLFFICIKKRKTVFCSISISGNMIVATLKSIGYYCFWAVFTSTLYVLIVICIEKREVKLTDIATLCGAYLLSWLSGFILPGAPGGIGIREMALTILVSPMGDSAPFIKAIIIYRIVNIIGDFIGMGLATLLQLVLKKRRRNNEKL